MTHSSIHKCYRYFFYVPRTIPCAENENVIIEGLERVRVSSVKGSDERLEQDIPGSKKSAKAGW